jgi:hypothetical protein
MVYIAPQWGCGAHCALWVLGIPDLERHLGYMVCVIHIILAVRAVAESKSNSHMQTCTVLRQKCEVGSCKSTIRCP